MSLIFVVLFALSAPSHAQNVEGAQEHAEKIKVEIDDNMVTMTNLVEALANTLGQLHYLRTLCFSSEDQKWRTIATDMMKIEAPNDSAKRSQFVQAFNNGYFIQKERYMNCEKTVSIDVAALSENGRRLSIMLADPDREP